MRFKLQQVLDDRGLSQAQAAKLAGVKRQYIQRIAAADHAGISLATLDRLCLALRCQPGELIELDQSTKATDAKDTGVQA